jgi:glycosyltransferase involved in cell wall biosynthesis
MPARRVLVNAISLTQGGGRSYVRNLLRELSGDPRGFEFTVLAAAGQLRPEEASGLEIVEVNLPGRRSVARTLLRVAYEEALLPLRVRDWDLLYCLADLAPAWGLRPSVVALRNLNIYDRRFYDGVRTRMLFRLVRLGLRSAARVVTPTAAAARFIAPRLGVPEARLTVVHHGIAPEAFQKDAQPVASPVPYLFLPANLERHKNFHVAFEALRLLADSSTELWIAGGDELDPPWGAHLRESVQRMGLASRVRFLGPVPYDRMLGYYRGARALVFPSLLETFGHPLLEAMLAGTPVVASDLPAFREVGGDVPLYFRPSDPAALARALERLAAEPEATQERIERGRERAKGFSWKRSVDLLCGVFDDALATAGRPR